MTEPRKPRVPRKPVAPDINPDIVTASRTHIPTPDDITAIVEDITPTKRPVGRPTDYDPAFCAMVIQYGKEGMSRATIASKLDCSRETLRNWEAAHPEFLGAMTRAKDEELSWWEERGRSDLGNKNFNAGLWSKSMAGRFPGEAYRPSLQVVGKNDGPVQLDVSNLPDDQLDRIETALATLATLTGGDAPGGEGGEGPAGGGG